MPAYTYNGPVMLFDTCIAYVKNYSTIASSEQKARSNLAYRWKKENGYSPNKKITLPGVITKEDSYE